MRTEKIKKALTAEGLTKFEIEELLTALKTSQKTTAFVATVKRRGASNMSAVVSICFNIGNHYRSLDFYLNKLCGYKWAKNNDGVIVNGCGFNRIYALLDDLAYKMGLEGKIKEKFCQFFTL